MRIHPRHKIYTAAKIRLTELTCQLMKELTAAEILSLLSFEAAWFADSCVRSERECPDEPTDGETEMAWDEPGVLVRRPREPEPEWLDVSETEPET